MVTPLQVTAEHIAQLHGEIVTTIFIATCENMYSPGYGVNPRQEGGVGFGNHLSPSCWPCSRKAAPRVEKRFWWMGEDATKKDVPHVRKGL